MEIGVWGMDATAAQTHQNLGSLDHKTRLHSPKHTGNFATNLTGEENQRTANTFVVPPLLCSAKTELSDTNYAATIKKRSTTQYSRRHRGRAHARTEASSMKKAAKLRQQNVLRQLQHTLPRHHYEK